MAPWDSISGRPTAPLEKVEAGYVGGGRRPSPWALLFVGNEDKDECPGPSPLHTLILFLALPLPLQSFSRKEIKNK